MKLIEIHSQRIILEIIDGKLIIYNRFLARQWAVEGIRIPPYWQNEYLGKQRVMPYEKFFLQALLKIYVPECLAKAGYRWQNS